MKDWGARMRGLGLLVAILLALGPSVPGTAAPEAPDGRPAGPVPGAATAQTEPSRDGARQPADGKDGQALSAIPLPPVLPTPRIDLPVAPDGGSPVPEGWALKEFAGKARVKIEKVGPAFAVHLSSDRASFSLYKDISVDLKQFSYLSWAWRVDQLPPKGDVRNKDTDDQAAQVYVIFPRFPELVRSQIIGYVWDSTVPAGTVLNSPSDRKAKIIVLRSGADHLGQWVMETRNVLEDYKRLFGGMPPKVGRISLLINSQHTRSTADSWFSGLIFTRNPLPHDAGISAGAMPPYAERDAGSGRPSRVN